MTQNEKSRGGGEACNALWLIKRCGTAHALHTTRHVCSQKRLPAKRGLWNARLTDTDTDTDRYRSRHRYRRQQGARESPPSQTVYSIGYPTRQASHNTMTRWYAWPSPYMGTPYMGTPYMGTPYMGTPYILSLLMDHLC